MKKEKEKLFLLPILINFVFIDDHVYYIPPTRIIIHFTTNLTGNSLHSILKLSLHRHCFNLNFLEKFFPFKGFSRFRILLC